jgi:hypothetical protein
VQRWGRALSWALPKDELADPWPALPACSLASPPSLPVTQVDAGAELYSGVPCLQGWRRGGQGARRAAFAPHQRQSRGAIARQAGQHTTANTAATSHLLPPSPSVIRAQVIPIYGRGSDFDLRHAEAIKVQPVPPRPAGQRPVVPGAPQAGQQGVLPALFGFQLGPGQGYVEALTPEQQHQAFLSRLLLMLGSFVIMCLLLF